MKSEGLSFHSSWRLRIFPLFHTHDKMKNILSNTENESLLHSHGPMFSYKNVVAISDLRHTEKKTVVAEDGQTGGGCHMFMPSLPACRNNTKSENRTREVKQSA